MSSAVETSLHPFSRVMSSVVETSLLVEGRISLDFARDDGGEFERLRDIKRNPKDDGMVVGHRNLDDVDNDNHKEVTL